MKQGDFDPTRTLGWVRRELEAVCRQYGVSQKEIRFGSRTARGTAVFLAKAEWFRRLYVARARPRFAAQVIGTSYRAACRWFQSFRERGL